MTFGRDEGEETFSGDLLMSGRHFQIHFFEGEVQLEDLKSSNKTRINGRAIEAGVRIALRKLDLIEFGNQRFIFTEGHEVPPAYRERVVRPLKAKSAKEDSLFESFLHAQTWHPSTRVAAIATFLIAMVFFLGYFPDFTSRQIHSPHKIVAEIIFVIGVVGFAFVFAHYFLVTRFAPARPIRFASALAVVSLAALVMFVFHSLLGVPRQLDQNRLMRDCRKIVKPAHYDWCSIWVGENKNQAYEGLPLEMRSEIQKALEVPLNSNN